MFQNALHKENNNLSIPHLTQEQKIHYSLRVASAMCLIGHGAFGIITKPIWYNYFAVFGIGHDLARQLMPLMGSFDILMGILILVYPMRIILAWLVFWGTVTALLRPLSGEPIAEFIERAGNFGAALSLLLLSGSGGKRIGGWFARINPNTPVPPRTIRKLTYCLRVVVFLLLLGHGWLNWEEKKSLLSQYSSLGFPNPAHTAKAVGIFEFIAAFSVLVRPFRSLLIGLLFWKIGTELFFPHYELFEWIERGGSFGAILALWLAMESNPLSRFTLTTQSSGKRSPGQ
jgi:hypothetical protein